MVSRKTRVCRTRGRTRHSGGLLGGSARRGLIRLCPSPTKENRHNGIAVYRYTEGEGGAHQCARIDAMRYGTLKGMGCGGKGREEGLAAFEDIIVGLGEISGVPRIGNIRDVSDIGDW